MPGSEYLSLEVLSALWTDVLEAWRAEIEGLRGSVEDWLAARDPAWAVVGRVHFHLAENSVMSRWALRVPGHLHDRASPREASRSTGPSATPSARPRPPPTGAGSWPSCSQSSARRSGARSSRRWRTPGGCSSRRRGRQARRTSSSARSPDSRSAAWSSGCPTGGAAPERRGRASPCPWASASRPASDSTRCSTSTCASRSGTRRSPRRSCRRFGRQGSGLALLKGRWVEVDAERLDELLRRWKAAKRSASDGLSFVDAMRLLSGAEMGAGRGWPARRQTGSGSGFQPGAWLGETLAALRGEAGGEAADPGAALLAELRPYQREGVRWLWTLFARLGLGGAWPTTWGSARRCRSSPLLLLLKRRRTIRVPTCSWSPRRCWPTGRRRRSDSPTLRVLVVHSIGNAPERARGPHAGGGSAGVDLVVMTYAGLARISLARHLFVWPWRWTRRRPSRTPAPARRAP